ncbi:ABC transporter permease [Candidatus Acetothermia bacterium]|nr:ABC transporter permease [Candidatus Acetothermia bacterium]
MKSALELAPATPRFIEAEIASPWKRARRIVRRFTRRRLAILGAIVIVIFVVAAILAPWLAPYNPQATNWSKIRKPADAQNWLGTDDLGRDLFSRLIWGAQVSLLAGVLSVLIAVVLGVPLGLIAGYYRGHLDQVIMRITDALLAFPFLIIAIALASALGPSLANATLAIGLSAVPGFIRLTRGQVLAVREEEYVQAARAVGASDLRIFWRYILPNSFAPLMVQATVSIAGAIIAESTLSFLGLGVQPPTPSWGSMLNVAQGFLNQAPWMAWWPGLAIFVTVLGFNLMGDGLRDALDPKDY